MCARAKKCSSAVFHNILYFWLSIFQNAGVPSLNQASFAGSRDVKWNLDSGEQQVRNAGLPADGTLHQIHGKWHAGFSVRNVAYVAGYWGSVLIIPGIGIK